MSNRKQGDRLKQEVEKQSERLRSLAGEIDRHADSAGLLSRGSTGVMRSWAALLRSISDELTEAVNDERDGRGRVAGLNRMTAIALAGITVLAPTINHVGSSIADEYLLPEHVAEGINEAKSGTDSISASLEATPGLADSAGLSDEARHDRLATEIAEAMTHLSLTDHMLGVQGVVSGDMGARNVTVTPHADDPAAWTLVAEDDPDGVSPDDQWTRDIRLPAEYSQHDVQLEIASWISGEAERRAMEIAEDMFVQDEIDRRRGK